MESCADPGIFSVCVCVSVGGGGGGGGGGSRPDGQKTVWKLFFLLFFKSSTYFTFYGGGPMVNYTFPRIQWGSNIYQGVQLFPGGGGGGWGSKR